MQNVHKISPADKFSCNFETTLGSYENCYFFIQGRNWVILGVWGAPGPQRPFKRVRTRPPRPTKWTPRPPGPPRRTNELTAGSAHVTEIKNEGGGTSLRPLGCVARATQDLRFAAVIFPTLRQYTSAVGVSSEAMARAASRRCSQTKDDRCILDFQKKTDTNTPDRGHSSSLSPSISLALNFLLCLF